MTRERDTFAEDLGETGWKGLVKRLRSRLRTLLARLGERLKRLLGLGDAQKSRRSTVARIGLAVILALVVVYYGYGLTILHTVDDDLTWSAPEPTSGGSLAVDAAASLIEREVEVHGWAANDPFFYPTALLDNMPNFQQGIIYALSRFTVEMSDHIGRARGSSQVDPDLDRAAGLLRYPGDRWIFDLGSTLLPTTPAEDQYLAAANALRSFNRRLGSEEATFEVRADNLMRTLDRMAADIGSASAVIAAHIESREIWNLWDTQVDDIFYRTKGRLYGYFIIVEALGEDFAPVIQQAGLEVLYAELVDSLRLAAALDPLMVFNGDPDGTLVPNHIAVQGFYLLRARTQLREVTNVLMN